MLKQAIIYLCISIAVIFLAKYIHLVIVYIDLAYTYVNVKLAQIFSPGETGSLIRRVFVLVIIPVIIVGLPALIYRLIKRKTMPYFFELIWIIWLIVVLSEILIR